LINSSRSGEAWHDGGMTDDALFPAEEAVVTDDALLPAEEAA
jgi:hypothetical protein